MTDYEKFLSPTGRHLTESAIRRMGTVVARAGDLVSLSAAVTATGSEARWVPFGGSVSTPPLLIAELAISGS